MNRRGFLGRVLAGITTAVVAPKVAAAADVPVKSTNRAQEGYDAYMRAADQWVEWHREHGWSHTHSISVGGDHMHTLRG